MNTLFRFMEANGMENKRIESLPASEVDHLLSKFFMNIRRKNGGEYEPATISSFQRSIQRYLTEKKYPFNILKDTWVWKLQKSTSCEAQVTSSRARQRKQAASRSGDWRKRRRCPFLNGRIRRLQSSCSSKNLMVVFILTLRFPTESGMKAVSYAGKTFSFKSKMTPKKFWFG